jgi:hypothetical protein
MKATFALLANAEPHNQVRKLAWDIHQKYRTGIDVCRLPLSARRAPGDIRPS